MRFVVDTNLPPALARWLVSQVHAASHTSDLGLERAPDQAIWQHAVATMAIIITKDEDFILLKARDQTGPRVVWIRIGNAIRRELLQTLTGIWPAVVAALEAGEGIVEVR